MNEISARITDPGKSPPPAQIETWLGKEANRYWIADSAGMRDPLENCNLWTNSNYVFHIRKDHPLFFRSHVE